MAHGRDLEHAVPTRLQLAAHEVGQLAGLRHVDLVEGDELRALEQRQLPLGHGIGGELGQDDVEIGDRVAPGLERRAVDDVQQRRAALDVPQELESESLALAGALDETRHVGDGEPVVAGLHDAEVRVERGERVVGDLGPCRGKGGDEARLAGRRISDERDVGDGLQLERDLGLVAEGAEQGEARCLALRGRERRVAEAAEATCGSDESHAGLGEVGELVALVILHDRADRHRKLEGLGHGARPVVAHARLTVVARAVRAAVVPEQCRDLGVCDEHDVAAVAAVAAVGAAERLELLTAYRDAPVATVPGAQEQRHLVDEADHSAPLTTD